MGIRESLQEALINANTERVRRHEFHEICDRRLVELKAALSQAESEEAEAVVIHKDAQRRYRELLDYRNSRTDESARKALDPEIERLAQNVNSTVRALGNAREETREARQEVTSMEKGCTEAQAHLNAATERWEQIGKQIEGL